MQKYHEEFPGEWSAEMTQKMLERAYNEYNYDLQYEKDRKDQEEYRRQMEQLELQRAEQKEKDRKQRIEELKHLPERQLKMFLSGERQRCGKCSRLQQAEFFGHAPNCTTYSGIDIEPGLRHLKDNVVDLETYNMIKEICKPGESVKQAINRLLDITAAKA